MTAIPRLTFARSDPPAPRGRHWGRGRAFAALLIVACVVLGSWGVQRWWTYPQVPDVAAVDLDTAVDFMGSDEFNRMLERHRLSYAMAVVDRLSGASFYDLSMMMMRWNDRRARIAKNLRDIEGHDQLGSKVLSIFLEKFYEQSPAERRAALIFLAAAQQGHIAQHPQAFALPTTEEFKQDMGRFIARQPPRTQAMFGQFVLDLKKQRDSMGLKDPF